MFRLFITALALAALPLAAVAQTAPPAGAMRPAGPDLATQQAAMARLSWMVGDWEETGWLYMPGGRQTFRQVEKIEMRLSGGVMVIEGRGYAGKPEALMFNALGVVSYDDMKGEYGFRSWARGYFTDAKAEVLNGPQLRWTMTFPGMTIRYTIRQTPEGRWAEIGERSTDNGASWTQFFEMNLTKKP